MPAEALETLARSTVLVATTLLVLPFGGKGALPGDTVPSPPAGWVSDLLDGHPLVGVLWDVRRERESSPDELLDRALEAEFVLLGEIHDNPDHHRLQAWVLEAMAARGARPAVAFEMIRVDRAEALERHLRESPGDAAGLGPAVGWEEEGWPDWAMYRPVAEAALAARLPVRPGDVSRAEQQAVARGGLHALGQDRRAALGLDRPLPEAKQRALEEELGRAHCDLMPEHALPAVAQVQRLKDAGMAELLVAASEASPTAQAVLIAGQGHVRTDRAVPWHLRQRDRGSEVLALGMMQVEEGRESPAEYRSRAEVDASAESTPPFDYLWFTPRPHDRDRCAELRERMEGVRGPP